MRNEKRHLTCLMAQASAQVPFCQFRFFECVHELVRFAKTEWRIYLTERRG